MRHLPKEIDTGWQLMLVCKAFLTISNQNRIKYAIEADLSCLRSQQYRRREGSDRENRRNG